MPDIDRLTDEPRADMATSPEDLAFAKGYRAGYARAVLAVLIMIAVGALLYFSIGLYELMGGA